MTAADRPLYRWEKFFLGLLVPGLMIFGYLIVIRSAYTTPRMTDLGVYTRAAWAVWNGENPYDVPCERGWHYNYPPPFVLMMLPLADPPLGLANTDYLRFDVSVVIWYLFGLVCTALAIHIFVQAVLPDAKLWSRRWWYARMLPFDLCAIAFGFTLSRGQVNQLVLLLMAWAFAASLQQRRLRSGFWLAAALALKIIPGYLILFPMIRWQPRVILGWFLGLVFWLALIPVSVWGFHETVIMYQRLKDTVLLPGMTNEGDNSRGQELINVNATDSQAFQAIFHNWLNRNRPIRPIAPEPIAKIGHWMLAGILTAITIFMGRRYASDNAASQLILFGSLSLLMVLISPASHMHYYALVFPLIAGVIALELQQHPDRAVPRWIVLGPLLLWALAILIPVVLDKKALIVQELGLSMWATLGLWTWSLNRLRYADGLFITQSLGESSHTFPKITEGRVQG